MKRLPLYPCKITLGQTEIKKTDIFLFIYLATIKKIYFNNMIVNTQNIVECHGAI